MTNPVRSAAVFGVALSLYASGASAAQPWTCICKGEPKRFLASTRHCETRSGLAKGEWCGKQQFRAVYGPACAAKGCKLRSLD
jgi:hypothetical protein